MAFDLCTVKRAENPFLIESVRIKVWSIEELCFFLRNNLCLIDRSVVNERLADWVTEELGLRTLGHKLSDALRRPDRDITYFIMPIFAEIGYLSQDDQRIVRKQLMEVQVQPEEESTKMKADYLVRCGKSAAARTLYRQILKSGRDGKLRTSFLESVWNNLGCAYAREFRFRKAAESFHSGYLLGHSRELLRKYLSCLPLYLDAEDYRQKIEEIGADPVFTAETQKMNAKCAEDISERILVRTRPDEDVREAAGTVFDDYRREAS